MRTDPVPQAPLVHLLYTSTAANLMENAALDALLAQSREKNARHDITGFLLYKSGYFVQVLEGPESAVRSLYAAIERDRRHRLVTLIFCRPIAEREFSEWQMGFRRVEANEPWPEGFSDLFTDPQKFRNLAAGKIGRLFQVFADSIR